ncbi:hypothetical protein Poly24_08220 [Rosistilla carotiformis]|uniref:DUF1570 domain-containing protein n=1 Tax=Rosistilla carotiformis TaxID=2528017 RepID=A0A518JNN8_9BACT|nr:hypothetical protein [Rosistilla carotiformis]QDV67131.1 hypothetical protein Poly24_08220 [Rosistilla carotiformis]
MLFDNPTIVAGFSPPRIGAALALCLFVAPFAAAQTRQFSGRHVTIHTDLPASAALDQLPAAFDAAVPQWCEFFGVDPDRLADWHVTAYLMTSRDAFKQRGLLPDHLPDFAHGYQYGNSVWVVDQPSDYYTRHLLLHEGVHALMFQLFGGAGPAWYMEGMAELLATHRWSDGEIALPVIPESREAFPFWGRLKVIQSARDKGQALPIDAVMRYSHKAHRQVEPYAWSWGALTLLNMYPEYRTAAIAATDRAGQPPLQFTRNFYSELKDQWPQLQLRWRMLVDGLDYGFDPLRNRIDLTNFPATAEASTATKQLEIAADRGWQSSGIRVAAGQSIRITAEGRYTLGDDPRPWECEPQGVTIEYHRGHPLGMLLAAVAPTSDADATRMTNPQIVGVGREGTFVAEFDGMLLLRIGDDPAALADNRGSASVTVSVAVAERP